MPRPSKKKSGPPRPKPLPGTATMQDVADALGLSVSTVSLSLGGRPTVAEATRRLVMETAEALGYRKNPLVAALMETRRRSRPASGGTVIAYLDFRANLAEVKRAVQPDFYPGCAAEAERMGLRLERFFVRDPAMPEHRLCSILKARGIRGAILGPGALLNYKPDFDWAEFCWTSMTVNDQMPPLDLVTSAHFGDTYAALQQARQLGYRRAALVVRQVADDTLRRAWTGAYLAHVGDINPDGPLEPYRDNVQSPDSFRKWYRRAKPDVLIGTIALSTLGKINQVVPEIPKKLGIISISVPQRDDTITGYRENWPMMEIEAVRHLTNQLVRNETGVPRVPRIIRIPGSWNPGTTTRPQA